MSIVYDSSTGDDMAGGSFDQNIDMFFTSELGLNWDPAEMVVGSGMEGEGLLPWLGTSHLGEFSANSFPSS